MESLFSTYNLNNVNELRYIREVTSELDDSYKRKIIDFILDEIEKLNKNLVQVNLEIDGDFDFTFKVKDDYLLWLSIQSPALALTILDYEYHWDMQLSYFRLEEEVFSFLKKIFSGDYWIERVETNSREIIRSSLNLGKNRNILQYYSSSYKKDDLIRHIIEREGVDLYKK